jgi:hypothetical protein
MSRLRAAAVIGSQARTGAYAADSSADYDLLVVTTKPDAYKHTDWLHAFGQVVSAVFDPTIMLRLRTRWISSRCRPTGTMWTSACCLPNMCSA